MKSCVRALFGFFAGMAPISVKSVPILLESKPGISLGGPLRSLTPVRGLLLAAAATTVPSPPTLGHVRVFQKDGGNWTQIGEDLDGSSSGDDWGYMVAISGSGSIVAGGATWANGDEQNSGHVRVFRDAEEK